MGEYVDGCWISLVWVCINANVLPKMESLDLWSLLDRYKHEYGFQLHEA